MNSGWKVVYFFVFYCFGICCCTKGKATNLARYTEAQVWRFLERVSRNNLTTRCSASLDKVELYLTDPRTLEEERRFYSESYATGDAVQFISRDHDRWLYSAFKCIKAAGETSYSASQYPMHYCYGYNAEKKEVVYGMCIPSTCSEDTDRVELLREWQQEISHGKDKMKLDYEDCAKSRHKKQWYEQTIPLLHFASDMLIVLIAGIATVLDFRMKGESKLDEIMLQLKNFLLRSTSIQLLFAFSATRNFRKLIQMPKDANTCITCMFGLRFFSMVWTLIGHSFIFVQAFLENVDEFKNDMVNNFWNQWITNFTLSVDIFLLLSGTLTSYTWFRKWQKNTTEQEPSWKSYGYWLRFYRHRVVRLWPAYIYTLVAVTTRVSITHFHPMWPPTDPAVQCPKHWYENVLFINSLTDNRCMPWTWYIGTEFIFYLLSPVFLLSLRQSPVLGFIVTIATCLISSLLNAFTMVQYNFPPTQMLWTQPDIFSPDYIKHHLVIYIKPWYRIGPYLIGIILGNHLAGFSCFPQKVQNRSKEFVFLGWFLALAAGFWSLYGLYPALQGWDWPFYHIFYGSTSRTIFAIAIGWVIYACHTGIGGHLNTLLSLPPLVPLSVLSYSVYLIHMIPVVFTYIVDKFPIVYTSKLYIFQHCAVQLALSYCFGIFCTMLAELPALNIERILLGLGEKRRREKEFKSLTMQSLEDCKEELKTNEAINGINECKNASGLNSTTF